MSKIFEWDARKGSFVEGVSKTVMTPTAVTFNKTDKGFAALFNGSTSVLNSNVSGVIGTGDRTIEIWFRTKTSGINSIALITDGQFIIRGSTSNNLLITNSGSAGGSDYTATLENSIKLNTWHHLIVVRQSNGTIAPYLDLANVFSSSSGSLTPVAGTNLTFGLIQNTKKHNGEISLVRVYDNLLSEKERENTYRDFLQSQITEKPVRGFESVKPTDLSYLKDTGLVAAYNMIPNGNTLVDISGNGRNGTLNGGLINTNDGLGFNGTNGYIGSLTSPTYTDKLSVSVRFKPTNDTHVGYKGVIGDWNLTSDKRSWFIAKETGAGNKYKFDISTTGLWVSGRSIATNTALTKNQVYTLTAVYDGAKIYMYLNGVKQTAERNVTGNLFQGDLLQIGTYDTNLTRCFPGEIHDIRIYNRVLTEQEIKDYHNSFIKPVTLEDWSNYAVGNTMPNEWIINSGAFVIAETTTRKYLACTSNGTIRINYPTTNTSVYASIEYYDGTSWITYTGLLSDLISTHAWLNLTGGYLEFTLTTSTRLGNIKIFDGVRQ